jgi:hypothetical protein
MTSADRAQSRISHLIDHLLPRPLALARTAELRRAQPELPLQQQTKNVLGTQTQVTYITKHEAFTDESLQVCSNDWWLLCDPYHVIHELNPRLE